APRRRSGTTDGRPAVVAAQRGSHAAPETISAGTRPARAQLPTAAAAVAARSDGIAQGSLPIRPGPAGKKRQPDSATPRTSHGAARRRRLAGGSIRAARRQPRNQPAAESLTETASAASARAARFSKRPSALPDRRRSAADRIVRRVTGRSVESDGTLSSAAARTAGHAPRARRRREGVGSPRRQARIARATAVEKKKSMRAAARWGLRPRSPGGSRSAAAGNSEEFVPSRWWRFARPKTTVYSESHRTAGRW